MWQKIKRYPNYRVLPNSRICSIATNTIKTTRKNNRGYHIVDLYHNGEHRTYLVHRLVAETFVPNPDNKPCVNHIDGDKDNNASWNLEWVTHQENSKKAYDNGQLKTDIINGENHVSAKLDIIQVTLIRLLLEDRWTIWETAKHFSVSKTCIWKVKNNLSWKKIHCLPSKGSMK